MTPEAALDLAIVVQEAVPESGQGRVALRLAQEMLERGHRLTVYSHALHGALLPAVRFRRLPRARGPQLLDDLLVLATASLSCARARHDGVWAVGPTVVGRRVVMNAHFSHRGWRRSWQRDWRRGAGGRGQVVHAAVASALEGLCTRLARQLVVPEATVARDLGRVGAGVVVMPNGVDPVEFAEIASHERSAARAELGIGAQEVVVAFVGGYRTPRKGLTQLLAAVARGPAHERLVVTGEGPAEELSATAAAMGIGARVVITGPRPARRTYAASDIVVVPSSYEPFSLVVLEAASCGRPVVVSACAGALATLQGVALVIDDPWDAGQIRAALDALERDPALAAALGRRGRERVLDRRWESCLAVGIEVLEEVARGQRPACSRRVSAS